MVAKQTKEALTKQIKDLVEEKEKASIQRLDVEGQVYHTYKDHAAAAKKGHWKDFGKWACDNDKYIKVKLDKLEQLCNNLKFETKDIPDMAKAIQSNNSKADQKFRTVNTTLE